MHFFTVSIVYIQIFLEVISVSLHMSVITQFWRNSALILAARWGMTEVVSLLIEAGANTDLQDKVHVSVQMQVVWEEIHIT